MAAPSSFAQIGHKNGTTFVPDALRAQDVWASTGISAEEHIADTSIHLTSDEKSLLTNAGAANGAATLGGDGKVPTSQLPSSALTVADISVTNITALIALSGSDAPLNSDVFVNDATGDATVTTGWALYRRKAITDGSLVADWTKVSEGEGLDVAFVDQTARDNAEAAQTAAEEAQEDAEAAQTTANLLDFAYCEDESDMNEKNLRDGAFVLMAVTNTVG